MKKTLTTLTIVGLLAGGTAFAQDYSAQLKARQGEMRIMAINLGILGSMAKGETEYSAEAAQAAADTLVAVSMIGQAPLWPAGSSEMDIEGTRAKAEMWDNLPDVLDKWAAFGDAAKVMQAAAGEGQAALGPALGTVGGTCKACHDAHRAPAN
ncbi:cytochrome c [Aestuariicoccus sp. MJ-SS9]|uniref:c-type cytochrome n=1 Tax=Aestuariicoccus sp. MJ-SS9 TaxID=3079855 RepID=UPI00290809DD|nr:cytochrome c [Aestuariicoccus sp. MJ-SS9]MDU8911531.1 cytochrome c [Aestuariicoccus sp. MJ-SS9]